MTDPICFDDFCPEKLLFPNDLPAGIRLLAIGDDESPAGGGETRRTLDTWT